jgi:hypothetical protein
MYSLFLDDIRLPNPFLKNYTKTWTVVRNYNEFVKIIKERGLPDFISFDHDLAHEHYPIFEAFDALAEGREIRDLKNIPYDTYEEKTGYHCALYLIEFCNKNKLKLPKWQVHSMNPVGAENIKQLLTKYENDNA